MALRRGFKTEANHTAEQVRAELGLGPLERLDPRRLAAHLAIPIRELTAMAELDPAINHLVEVDPSAFSAVTIFAGTRRTIVHNDRHGVGRQNSNLAHELAHGLLHHPPTPPMDASGFRIWNQDIEDEANWLAGVLLVSEAATIEIAKRNISLTDAAHHFAVSEGMVRWRINMTGARKRVQRLRRSS
jgi:hypothetical protein